MIKKQVREGGGLFAPVLGGQFGPEKDGQFAPVSGGHFDRFFHINAKTQYLKL